MQTVRFLSRLELTNDPDDDGDWLLVSDFHVALGERDLCIPADFRTDLASTPRWLWPIFPPFGRWDEAAVLHDWIYRAPGMESRPTREEADSLFLLACLECGVSWWRANLMYAAVRLFGSSSYQT